MLFSDFLSAGYFAFIDAEHALDPLLAETIGINTQNLLLSQPGCGEQALSLVDTLIRSGSVDVVVVDSVAALVPKGELDAEMGDAHMAMQARLMSQALLKLSHSLSLSQCILIYINQLPICTRPPFCSLTMFKIIMNAFNSFVPLIYDWVSCPLICPQKCIFSVNGAIWNSNGNKASVSEGVEASVNYVRFKAVVSE
ncbi:hypothetical protein Dimus_030769, partial [Dionaea muscipula]